jgi:hypothetical protein
MRVMMMAGTVRRFMVVVGVPVRMLCVSLHGMPEPRMVVVVGNRFLEIEFGGNSRRRDQRHRHGPNDTLEHRVGVYHRHTSSPNLSGVAILG